MLTPLLFLIFINNIIQDLHYTIRLYAEHILIYFTICTPEDCVLLQHDLISLQTWQMELNPSKCIHLTISNKHHTIKCSYYISSHLIQKVSNTKYLGVIFNEHLTWKNHIHDIYTKANAAQAFIRRNINYCCKAVTTSSIMNNN